ncbi:NUDIX hydrolase [Izhakiella australiensis]|uniref:NUDIX hydrolase n=1 Tax=Izhakiella australiensis TaxID=1926881 RepID=A0A1S8YL42_9GAMM|nr:NUDIX hydrolase [Izhakiella australiensis]OON39760.1 NUDIX hydrolase [Izhakiella australiensis]
MLILIAGPVKSGTNGEQTLITANLNRLRDVALEVYYKGHTPVIGEWLAIPLAEAAGSQRIGDDISDAFLYPVARRLIHACDAVVRIAGASQGADNDVRLARELGLPVFSHPDEIDSPRR